MRKRLMITMAAVSLGTSIAALPQPAIADHCDAATQGAACEEVGPALEDFIDIRQVPPGNTGVRAGRGSFTSQCGRNENGHRNSDNHIVAPGVSNGAHHVHDYVGNLTTNGFSTDQSLAAGGTTCRFNDKSAYFWPALRSRAELASGANNQNKGNQGNQGNVNQGANNTGGDNTGNQQNQQNQNVNNQNAADPAASASPSASAAGDAAAAGAADAGAVNQDGANQGNANQGGDNQGNQNQGNVNQNNADQNNGNQDGANAAAAQEAKAAAAAAADPAAGEPGGAADGNVGTILQARQVLLQFRGNPTSRVVAMPRFLRLITGDAKAATNGGANARAAWTCTGFTNRTTTKYPLCPRGSQVVRILDFPSCWDGQNTDSANHRTHVVFPGGNGTCSAGTRAIPQLRMMLVYSVRPGPSFAVDAFPEQQHNPITDHADFHNVMSEQLMRQVVACINQGRRC